jgi:hypothetical protein
MSNSPSVSSDGVSSLDAIAILYIQILPGDVVWRWGVFVEVWGTSDKVVALLELYIDLTSSLAQLERLEVYLWDGGTMQIRTMQTVSKANARSDRHGNAAKVWC